MRLSVCAPAVLAFMLASPQAAPPQKLAPTVKVDNFRFTPATLSVPAGTTITWINADDVPHTIVSVEGKFHSHALDTDDSFRYRFDTAGTYKYYCSVHPRMLGTIVVTK